jgi:heme-degrading monooxygenase HmoA
MVTEIARFRAQPGKADELAQGLLGGAEVIKTAKGCQSIRVSRCIEDDSLFMYQIEWVSLDYHVNVFRKSALFAEYRSHINGLFIEPVDMVHFETFSQ